MISREIAGSVERRQRFNALSEVDRDILAVMAAVGEPVVRSTLSAIAIGAGIRQPGGRRQVDTTFLKSLLQRWEDSSFTICDREYQYTHSCAVDVRHWALERAAKSGLLRRLQSSIERFLPTSRWRYYSDPDCVLRDIRLILYLDPSDEQALVRYQELKAACIDRRDTALIPLTLASLFGTGAPTDAIALLPEPILLDYIEGCLIVATHQHFPLGEGFASFLMVALSRRPALAQDALTMALYLGAPELCRQIAAQSNDVDRKIGECFVALIAGDFATARDEAKQALVCSRGPKEKRKPQISGSAEPWLALLLLTSEDSNALSLAKMMVERRQSRGEARKAALGMLTDFRTALETGAKLPVRRYHSSSYPVSDELWQRCLFSALTETWINAKVSDLGGLRHEMAQRANSAEQGNYAWLAAQFRNFTLRSIGSEDPGAPLLKLFRERDVWEHILDALNAVVDSTRATSRPSAEADTLRVRWEIALSDPPAPPTAGPDYEWSEYQTLFYEPITVTPRLQRCKAGKWSAGSLVSLPKLKKVAAEGKLNAADQRVCQAIEESLYRIPTKMRFSEYVGRSLVGHPLVFWPCGAQAEAVAAKATIVVQHDKKKLRLTLQPELEGPEANFQYRRDGNRLLVYAISAEYRRVAKIVGTGAVLPLASEAALKKTLGGLASIIPVASAIDVEGGDAKQVPADARPIVQMRRTPEGVALRILGLPLGTEGPEVLLAQGQRSVAARVAGEPQSTERDLAAERRLLEALRQRCPALPAGCGDDYAWTELPDLLQAYELLAQLAGFEREEVSVTWPKGDQVRLVGERQLHDLRISLSNKGSWLEASGSLKVDENAVLTLASVIGKVRKSEGRFVELSPGKILALSKRLHRSLVEISDQANSQKNAVKLHPLSLFGIREWIADVGEFKSSEAIDDKLARIEEATTLQPDLPSTLQAELRDYQLQGFHWLSRLAHWGGGACLADDMGLGKTLQALALLLARAETGPALVVAPKSVCPGWITEARRFCPTLNPLRYGEGEPKERDLLLKTLKPYDVVVVSYGLLTSNIEQFEKVTFSSCVLDEAQAIKNATTKRARAVLQLKADCRLVTTGTPIENHLGEIWSQMTFLNPGLLGTSGEFKRRFARPIQVLGDAQAAKGLKRLLSPFILRRKKSEVLDELPAKTESVLSIEASEAHATFYEALRMAAEAKIKGPNASRKMRMQVLAEIMKLRRAACHPRLVQEDCGIKSTKMETALTLIDDLREGGHKALVFSQFVGHLTLLRERLDDAGIAYQYLDGSTSDRKRQQAVAAFQRGEGDLFLISLKAGGFGLNLTAADYVIHLDPWWNPATEDQATDRAHRIGQKRPVTIYRLVMAGTIEEKVLELHGRKRQLAADILSESDTASPLSVDMLRDLLKSGSR